MSLHNLIGVVRIPVSPHVMGAPTLSVIVPALNEARNLERVLPQLPPVHEVILVDGGSADDTVDTARRVLPGIRVVHQSRRGKGNALAAGFAAATGDIIVMFDADGSADPTEIDAYVTALINGADFAKGSRYTTGGGSEDLTLLRSFGNRALNIIVNTLLGTRYTDLCYGYNAFWRRILPIMALPHPEFPAGPDHSVWGDGFEIETIINCRVAAAQLRVVEVPSVEKSRIFGTSNLRTFRDGLRVLRTILQERRLAATAQRAHRDAVDAAVTTVDRPTAPVRLADVRNHLERGTESSADRALEESA